MRYHRCIWIICYVWIFTFCISCNSRELYHEFISFTSSGWKVDQSSRFVFTVTDTLSACNTFIEVRNSNDYIYRNLWLFVDFQTPDGFIRTDTLNCLLADEYGKWLGKGFSLFTNQFPYQLQYQFPHTGNYSWTIRHGIRENELKGISDIGVRVVISD